MLLAVAVVLGACQSSSRQAALPAGPPVITITMHDLQYDYNHSVPAGRVIFRMVNTDQVEHHPQLFPLAANLPPIDEQVRGTKRAVVAPFAGVPARKPGQVGIFAVNLTAGDRYGFVCFARTADGKTTHASLGMATEFRPSKPPGAS